MPELTSIAILILSIAIAAGLGCWVAFRAIIHILDKWMR